MRSAGIPAKADGIAVPRWTGSIGILAFVYVAVMVAASLWLPRGWDAAAFDFLSSRVPPAFSPDVGIVDVAWDRTDIPADRRRIASLLDGLARAAKDENKRPAAVILDVEFQPCQGRCEGDAAAARSELVKSIRAATPFFPVYAVVRLDVDRNGDVLVAPAPHDGAIYGALTGAAHTTVKPISGASGLFYQMCYPNVPVEDSAGAPQGTQSVWAMVVRVVDAPMFAAGSPPCATDPVTVRVGPKVALAPPAVYRFSDAKTFSDYARFDKRYVIAGTLAYDISPYTDRPGPELVGWAFSNVLERASLVGTPYDAQPANVQLLLLVPAFSGLAVVGYLAAFYQFKRMRLRASRRLLPWFSSAVALVFGFVVFAAFEVSLFAAHHIQPQLTLVSLGMVVACGLCGFRGFQILFDEANAIDPGATETYDYDVFISYAHDEGAWVFEHVYVPFRDAVLPNGKKLSVFFDTSSIRTGTGWQTTLALAIDASRFIVPVYSDIYFSKPYCRFEIMRAHRKWVVAGDESRCVLPVKRGHPKILATVNDIQALSIDDHPDLVQELVVEVVERLSHEPRDAPAPHTVTP